MKSLTGICLFILVLLALLITAGCWLLGAIISIMDEFFIHGWNFVFNRRWRSNESICDECGNKSKLTKVGIYLLCDNCGAEYKTWRV